jgi:hypothetical protein
MCGQARGTEDARPLGIQPMTTMSASGSAAGPYPVSLDVDGPQPQNRLSVLLRIIFAIPTMIALIIFGIVAEVITLIAWFVIVITGKYPSGMANFVEGYAHLSARATGYMWLLTDKSPGFSTGPDESYPIRLSLQTQLDGRNRVTVFFRIFMLIPHAIALYIITLIGEIVVFISWIAALVTGSVPLGMHNFIAGWSRWQARVGAYALLLTDEYPPFSLN